MPKFGLIQFQINGKKYNFNTNTKKGLTELKEFTDSVESIKKYIFDWKYYINLYKNFNKELDKFISYDSLNNIYYTSSAYFIEFITYSGIDTFNLITYIKNSCKLKTLEFEQRSYDILIISNIKSDIEYFLRWNYKKHVNPVLKSIKSSKI